MLVVSPAKNYSMQAAKKRGIDFFGLIDLPCELVQKFQNVFLSSQLLFKTVRILF